MKSLAILPALLAVSLIFGVACGDGKSAAAEFCELDCLQASREKVQECGDNQVCKQEALAAHEECVAACPE